MVLGLEKVTKGQKNQQPLQNEFKHVKMLSDPEVEN